MRGGRRDTTHGEIREAIRAMGWSCEDTGDASNGLPDFMVGIGDLLPEPPRNVRGIVRAGEIYFVDAKSPGGKLTEKQVKFMGRWRGNYIVAESGAEAVSLISQLRARKGRG